MIRGSAPSAADPANALLARAYHARTRRASPFAAFRAERDETDKADTLPLPLAGGDEGVGPSLRTLVKIGAQAVRGTAEHQSRAKLTHAQHGQLGQLPLAPPPLKRATMPAAYRALEG